MGSGGSKQSQSPADNADNVHVGPTTNVVSGPDNGFHILEIHPGTAFGTIGTLLVIGAAAYAIHRCHRGYRRRQERDILRRHRLPKHPAHWDRANAVAFDGPRFQEVDNDVDDEAGYEASRPLPSRLDP